MMAQGVAMHQLGPRQVVRCKIIHLIGGSPVISYKCDLEVYTFRIELCKLATISLKLEKLKLGDDSGPSHGSG